MSHTYPKCLAPHSEPSAQIRSSRYAILFRSALHTHSTARYKGDWVQSPIGTTLTVPSTDFGAQIVGVAVSQVVSLAVGTLHTPLNGATTTVVVTPTSGTFDTTNAITINGHATKPVPTAMDLSATTKWGDIGDWDVSGVADFSYAFSLYRDANGGFWDAIGGNLKAATFVGTAMSKWITTSLTSLECTFQSADEMNSDLSGWNVAKVTTLAQTFSGASKFVGTGLVSWDTASVLSLYYSFKGANAFTGVGIDGWNVGKVLGTHDKTTFDAALALTDCRKLEIVTAWALNAAFISANPTILTVYAASPCPVRSDHEADERFSPTPPTHHPPIRLIRALPPLYSNRPLSSWYLQLFPPFVPHDCQFFSSLFLVSKLVLMLHVILAFLPLYPPYHAFLPNSAPQAQPGRFQAIYRAMHAPSVLSATKQVAQQMQTQCAKPRSAQ